MKTNRKKTPQPAFAITPPPANCMCDGEVIDFATLGKTVVQQWCPGPEHKTQLMIEDEQNGDFDFTNLDITHHTRFNRYNVRFEAMDKAECLLAAHRQQAACKMPKNLRKPLSQTPFIAPTCANRSRRLFWGRKPYFPGDSGLFRQFPGCADLLSLSSVL